MGEINRDKRYAFASFGYQRISVPKIKSLFIACIHDCRIEYIREYTLTSMRLKIDKWNKIIISDEQRSYLLAFVDKPEPQQMVISQNIAGHLQVWCCAVLASVSILKPNPNILQIHTDWPSPMRNKGVFFVKKEKKPMPAENFDFAEHMAVGDIYPNVLGLNYSVFTRIEHYNMQHAKKFRLPLFLGWGSSCAHLQ